MNFIPEHCHTGEVASLQNSPKTLQSCRILEGSPQVQPHAPTQDSTIHPVLGALLQSIQGPAGLRTCHASQGPPGHSNALSIRGDGGGQGPQPGCPAFMPVETRWGAWPGLPPLWAEGHTWWRSMLQRGRCPSVHPWARTSALGPRPPPLPSAAPAQLICTLAGSLRPRSGCKFKLA